MEVAVEVESGDDPPCLRHHADPIGGCGPCGRWGRRWGGPAAPPAPGCGRGAGGDRGGAWAACL